MIGSRAMECAVNHNKGGVTQNIAYVGLDVHKASISISVAEDGRDGAVRFIGTIPNTPGDVLKLVRRLAKDIQRLEFCYEAGGCGNGIYRQIVQLGQGCTVVAPSMIPRKPGDRRAPPSRDRALSHGRTRPLDRALSAPSGNDRSRSEYGIARLKPAHLAATL
jgi:hypothetical protein